MAEILLVNPRRRRSRGRKKVARRRVSAARRPARRRRRRNPIGPYAKKAGGMGMYVSNPRRRRRPARKRRSTARRRYKRNPAFTMRNAMNTLVIPALQAGAGAVALDVMWGFVPIPETLKSGPMRHVAKGLGAIVLGQVVGMVATKRVGNTIALGALTVTAYNAIREMTAQFMPQIPLGYYSPGATAGYDPQLGMYVSSPRLETSRGESVPSPNSEVGYYVQEGAGAQY